MFFKFSPYSPLLLLLSILTSITSAVPNLGIQKDYAPQFPRDGYQSYSAIISFDDISIPGDQTKMSDAQFIYLAKVAYDEMIVRWEASQLSSDGCPGAMTAMESEGRIYFASAVRSISGIDINAPDRDIFHSVGWYQWACVMFGEGTHRTGGRCGEPNVLRLYGDVNGIESTPNSNLGRLRSPPKTDNSPRIATWGRPSGTQPRKNHETFFRPCLDPATSGYGCQSLVVDYGLKSVSSQTPDPNGQDNWNFSRDQNPRGACPVT